MSNGRFLGGIGALIWSPERERYLLLRRSPEKDFAAGVWECVTGRVKQGESFTAALQREGREEIGVEIQPELMLGTTHFYRGEPVAENELIGVAYFCSLQEPDSIQISAEHVAFRWVTANEAMVLLTASDPSTQWTRRLIARAEAIRQMLPPNLRDLCRSMGFELS